MPLALAADDLDVSFAFVCGYALSGRARVRLYRSRPGADIKITPQVLNHLGNDLQKGCGQVMDYMFRDVFIDSDFIKDIHVFINKDFKKTRLGPPPPNCKAAGMVLSAYDYRILVHHLGHLLDTVKPHVISTYTDSYTLVRHEGMLWQEYQTAFSATESLLHSVEDGLMENLHRCAIVRVRKYRQGAMM